jgi:hypothetical protein
MPLIKGIGVVLLVYGMNYKNGGATCYVNILEQAILPS